MKTMDTMKGLNERGTSLEIKGCRSLLLYGVTTEHESHPIKQIFCEGYSGLEYTKRHFC